MARPTLVPMICAAGAAVLLALGGCGGAVEEAADAGAVAQPADEGAPPDDGAGDGTAPDGGDGDTAGGSDGSDGGDGNSGNRPGRPGEVSAGGGGARPGAPFDQPVFQDRGRDFDDDARQSLEDRCAGVCTVAYSITEDPDDPSLTCRISDFSYEPADSGGFFQVGAEVTVHVTCPVPQTSEGETAEGEPSEGETTEEGTTQEGTTEGETTEGETTEEETTEEGTTEGGTTDEETSEDPAG